MVHGFWGAHGRFLNVEVSAQHSASEVAEWRAVWTRKGAWELVMI